MQNNGRPEPPALLDGPGDYALSADSCVRLGPGGLRRPENELWRQSTASAGDPFARGPGAALRKNIGVGGQLGHNDLGPCL